MVDPAGRADVRKLLLEAQVVQKAKDTRLRVCKLEQAMMRANIPRR